MDIHVYLTVSTGGFDTFNGSSDVYSTWSLMFTVINFDVEQRYKAGKVIPSAFIPGTHCGNYFDTFLFPFCEDLVQLMNGIEMLCADGRKGTLNVFLLFRPAHWLASTKCRGYAGHIAKLSCRL